MAMQKIAITELSKPVRSFLAKARNGEGIVVEDETGRPQFGITPYIEATTAQKKRAWKGIKCLQRKVGKAMKAEGVKEQDIERLILEDD